MWPQWKQPQCDPKAGGPGCWYSEVAGQKQPRSLERPYHVLLTNTAGKCQAAGHWLCVSQRRRQTSPNYWTPIPLEDVTPRVLMKPHEKAAYRKGELQPEMTDGLLTRGVDNCLLRHQTRLIWILLRHFSFPLPLILYRAILRHALLTNSKTSQHGLPL